MDIPKPIRKEETQFSIPKPVRATEVGGYSKNDLLEDRYYIPIENYMRRRYGDQVVGEGISRKDIVNQYLNNMRGFSGGNSVRAVSEVSWLNSLEEEEYQIAGEAYSIYENMENLFGGEMTIGERADGFWDFTRTSLLDPVNILSFGLGKAAASGGSKTATVLAQKSAKKAYLDAIKKGASKEVAKEAGDKIWSKEISRMAAEETAKAVQRQSIPAGVKRLGTSAAGREIGAAMTSDALLSMGTDRAYQYGLILTDNQEEHSWAQTGLAAFGSLIMGGIQVGGILATGRTGFVIPEEGFKPNAVQQQKSMSNVLKDFGEDVIRYVEKGNWKDDVAKGRQLSDIDNDFWRYMLIGNEDLGIKGLARSAKEQGYVYIPREEDSISNFVGDLLKDASEEDIRGFISLFENNTGIKMTDLSPEGEGIQVVGDFVEEFSNNFKKWASDSGRNQNALSQTARILGKDPKDVTREDIAKHFLPEPVDEKTKGFFSKYIDAENIAEKVGSAAEKFQNNTIRMIVSNLATTQLNVGGWAFASAMNSLSDISLGIMHGGGKILKSLAVGDIQNTQAGWRQIKSSADLQRQKIANLLDPQMTYDTWKAMAEAQPQRFREQMYVLPGGIEDTKKLSRNIGFDADQTNFGDNAEAFVDFVGRTQFVKMQDVWTKSQEYMYQIDKGIRAKYGQSLSEFMSDPNVAAKMATQEYAELHAKANYETMRAIFSQSFKGKGAIGEIAAVIEDARNIPGVGILVPFGRFFNNTLAFMSDSLGVSAVAKAAGFNKQRSTWELASRAAMSYGLVFSLMDSELEYADMGLNWDQAVDKRTGEVVSYKFAFPYSAYKAAARLAALKGSDNHSVPPELGEQILKDVFGQLTRQLDETTQGTLDIVLAAMSDDGPDAGKLALEAFRQIGSQFGSGWTRFLEPFNQTLSLTQGTDFKSIDRKQGNRFINDTFRYMDQFGQVFGIQEGEQRVDAARGEPRADASKFMSPTRYQGPLSNTERVLNIVGKPTFKLNSMTLDAGADNRYNQLFNAYIEREASKLIENKSFQEGDLRTRQMMVDKIIQKSKKFVMDQLESGVSRSGDAAFKLMFDINNKGRTNVERVLRERFDGKKLDDLSYNQLLTLEGILNTEDDIRELGIEW